MKEIGQIIHPQIKDLLMKILRDKKERKYEEHFDIQKEAADALGNYSDEEVIKLLFDTIAHDNNAEVRIAAIDALSKLTSLKDTWVVNRFISDLENEMDRLFTKGEHYLGNNQDAWSDPEETYFWLFATHPYIYDTCNRLGAGTWKLPRSRDYAALPYHRYIEVKRQHEQIKERNQLNKKKYFENHHQGIGYSLPDDEIKKLMNLNDSSGVSFVKSLASDTEELAAIKDEPLGTKRDRNERILMKVKLLGVLREQDAIQPLIKIYPLAEKSIQKNIIYSLGKIRNPQAIEFLTNEYKNNSDEDIQLLSIQTLSEFPTQQVCEILKNAATKNPDNKVRAKAAVALGRFQRSDI